MTHYLKGTMYLIFLILSLIACSCSDPFPIDEPDIQELSRSKTENPEDSTGHTGGIVIIVDTTVTVIEDEVIL